MLNREDLKQIIRHLRRENADESILKYYQQKLAKLDLKQRKWVNNSFNIALFNIVGDVVEDGMISFYGEQEDREFVFNDRFREMTANEKFILTLTNVN